MANGIATNPNVVFCPLAIATPTPIQVEHQLAVVQVIEPTPELLRVRRMKIPEVVGGGRVHLVQLVKAEDGTWHDRTLCGREVPGEAVDVGQQGVTCDRCWERKVRGWTSIDGGVYAASGPAPLPIQPPATEPGRYPPDDRRRTLHLVELRGGGVHYAQVRPGQEAESDVYVTLCGRGAGLGKPEWSLMTKPTLSCKRCAARFEAAEQPATTENDIEGVYIRQSTTLHARGDGGCTLCGVEIPGDRDERTFTKGKAITCRRCRHIMTPKPK